jgi:AcrR family transcriptional regulator
VVCDEPTYILAICQDSSHTYVESKLDRDEARLPQAAPGQLEEETRLRITEAAVDLHGSVGPARTTISAVADRAGVQRATIYRHFPDEEALFDACSSHWTARHPLPDPAAWAKIEDPGERLRTALGELYDWYERGDYMLERTTRDLALVPALRPSMEALAGWFDAAADALLRGRRERGDRRRRLRAAVGHALAYETWRSLVRHQGMTHAETIELMQALVAAAARA